MFKKFNELVNKDLETDEKLSKRDTNILLLTYIFFVVGCMAALYLLVSPCL